MDAGTYLGPLERGREYTKTELAELWGLGGFQALQSGVFTPKNTPLIFIFITLKKTSGIDYDDLFDRDLLSMDGQTKHGTDARLINAHANGDETHLFYRETREDPFEYIGEIRLESYTIRTKRPSRFIYRVAKPGSVTPPKRKHSSRERLSREQLDSLLAQGDFDADRINDERVRTQTTLVARRGQASFRAALLRLYDGKCVISGCDFKGALEAAHIVPYLGPQTNHPANGLLLRADLHNLFDLGELWIDPETYKVQLSESLRNTVYKEYEGKKIQLPAAKEFTPSKDALRKLMSLISK